MPLLVLLKVYGLSGRALRQGILYGRFGPRLDVLLRVDLWRNGFLREAQGYSEQQHERSDGGEFSHRLPCRR